MIATSVHLNVQRKGMIPILMFLLVQFLFQVAITSVLLSTKILEMKWEARRGGDEGGIRAPLEIFRFKFNSATKVEFCLLDWTAVNGSSSFQVLSVIVR